MQAVDGVVLEADVDLGLKGFDGLLVREVHCLFDDLAHEALRVRARRIDPREESLEEGTLVGCGFGEPAPEVQLGAEKRVRTTVRADEHEAADEVAVAEREWERDWRAGAKLVEARSPAPRARRVRQAAEELSADPLPGFRYPGRCEGGLGAEVSRPARRCQAAISS